MTQDGVSEQRPPPAEDLPTRPGAVPGGMNVNLELPSDLARLLRDLPALRQAYLVGGCVRDSLLGQAVKDFDLEVFGVDYQSLADALRPHGRVDFVGRSFGVVKLSLGSAVHDFSIPRKDSKTGPGHRGFTIELDPRITPREAAARRDFTFNALMFDPRSREILDFFRGRSDLQHRILRHTGPTFVEDPLRVLRGMQFAARFDLTPAPETVELSRSMGSAFPQLAVERVREEWFKWAAAASRPSAGLRFLDACDWIRHSPELAGLRGVPQDPSWHPEGDVFTHTCHCLDALASLPEWRSAETSTRIVLMLAVLAHDFGKAVSTTTVQKDGVPRIVSPGHEQESVPLAESFLARMRVPAAIVERVLPLALCHMAHFQEVTERAVRRLARRLAPETVEHLCVVMTADAAGRPPRPPQPPPAVDALRRVAARLRVADSAPRPILLGRHLLAIGLEPGPAVGRWTSAAFEAQLDGQFQDLRGAYSWLAAQQEIGAHERERAARLSD